MGEEDGRGETLAENERDEVPGNGASEAAQGDSALLARVVELAEAHLPKDRPAQGFLRRIGLTDPEVWRRFRLGSGAADFNAVLNPGQRQRLRDLCGGRSLQRAPERCRGILLPTCDPRDWQQPLGLIKIHFSQNQHEFVTSPRGVACAQAVREQERILLADAPLTALRLAQAGGEGVCLIEDPRVLRALGEFLKGRAIALVSHKQERLDALVSALGRIEPEARLLLSGASWRGQKTLSAWGIAFPEPKPKTRPRLTQRQIVELVRYAQERLAAGHGVEVLQEYGADQGELNAVLQFGYLPPDFRQCLNANARRSWEGHLIANSIVIPALDEQGLPVDFLSVATGRVRHTLHARPLGLVGARVAQAFGKLIVTDSLRLMAKLFREGCRNVILLRGVADARQNAPRLYSLGVREALVVCHALSGETAAMLEKAGIATTRGRFPKFIDGSNSAPAASGRRSVPQGPSARSPTECIRLLNFDPHKDQAVFEAGQIRYSADVGHDGTRVLLRLERDGRAHVDRFDLASEAQRRRFALSAAPKAKESFERIEAHLLSLLDQIESLRNRSRQTSDAADVAAGLSGPEREAALAELKRSDLLERVAADLEALGWVGEDQAKRILYLTAISRKLPKPLSAVRVATSGAGKSFGLELVAELTPPEDLLHLTRLTDAALYYHEADGLRHKLLLVDEASALTAETLTTLRVLQSRGAVSHSHVLRDAEGENVARYTQAQGPVAVFTSTTGKLDEQNLSRCFVVTVDESKEQTARVLEAQRRMRSHPDTASGQRRALIVARHRNMQRLLEYRSVLIPFADRIRFPAKTVKHRREQERFLNLIEACALLHQHQRKLQAVGEGVGIVVAQECDFECAAGLASDSVARANDDFSQNARDVLLTIARSKLTTFSINDLHALRPEWTRHKFRSGLSELTELEILVSAALGRGRVRHYALHSGTRQALSGCSVKLEQVGELATVGETDLTNFIPVLAKG